MEWNRRREVKKGNYGEDLVCAYLKRDGWVIYKPENNGPHPFDRLCVKNKREIMIAECKTKSRMSKYNGTGVNTKNYEEYCAIVDHHKLELFLFFVDENAQEIYGNYLSILQKPYTDTSGVEFPKRLLCRNGDDVTIFSCEKMEHIAYISNKAVDVLKTHTSRNWEYPQLNLPDVGTP